jgi:hypothetical protein
MEGLVARADARASRHAIFSLANQLISLMTPKRFNTSYPGMLPK